MHWCQNWRTLGVAHHYPGWSVLSTVVRIVVLSVVTVSEYPLPLFVPDSLPHYWRRINSGHWQPRCGYKSITTAPFVVSTQSCNGISDNQELLQLSHTTLLLLNIQIHLLCLLLCSSSLWFQRLLFKCKWWHGFWLDFQNIILGGNKISI